jgi:transposase
MSQTRKNYSEEFKREAVALMERSANKARAARDLGVHVNVLNKWRRKIKEDGEKAFPGKGNPRDEELARLERENARLKEENEILKKAVGIFSGRPR